MPAVSTSSKVLLTGGTGFLGAWILKDLLSRGFNVRAAVRNESKAAYLQNLFKEYSSQLEFTIVEDITAPGAFDKAVQGVDGIIHTASPLGGTDPLIEPHRLIEPAVNGTVGVLKSAANGSEVKRVVITSSVGSLWDTSKALPFVFTEDVWNESAPKMVEEKGKETPLFIKYAASKTLAERAAWELVDTQKPTFDLVTVLPAFVWGQVISETTADIQGSNKRLLTILKKSEQGNYTGDRLLEEWQLVDVRDAAKLHVDALLSPEAGGQRFIGSAQTIAIQRIFDILNADPIEGFEVPRGQPELLNGWTPKLVFSGKKSEEVLGMKYRPAEETVRNTVVHALALGWKQ